MREMRLNPVPKAAGGAIAGGYVYPHFEAEFDLGYFRVAGAGIGNCLITYCHAMMLARRIGARLIEPAWPSLKLGPLLRGEHSKRFYLGLFRAAPSDVSGPRKGLALASGLGGSWRDIAVPGPATARSNGRLTVVSCRKHIFEPLFPAREDMRRRLLEIAKPRLPLQRGWGNGDYIAVHVRLGDFAQADPEDPRHGNVNNLRIPLAWYEGVLRRLRAIFPGLPVHVFSDGAARELSPLLAIDGVRMRREGDDLSDLAALAGARLLVGSQSTFSRWAAFLGDMPSIWLATEAEGERYCSDDVPFVKVGTDTSVITGGLLG
ncbi:hypothetical protein SAMN05518801_10460 [Novosphingobium sp. CF614]|uniref:hypothetical protein n=1 Tax=Novosphingobium sp. CF614 TaxID=1884364 RepID=UPI0008EB92ED|nr:hypothetical protein [Novosphingobium sp. CF614]SFF94671.1 hypothetical protein SAMN05518801_10460 [Novosphingobium sp. CF614]